MGIKGLSTRTLWQVPQVQRDRALAAALFVALLINAVVGSDPNGISVLGVLAALLATAPVGVRSRWPIPAAFVATVATAGVVSTLGAVDVVAVPVFLTLYTVGASGGRRRSLVTAVGVTLVAVAVIAASAPAGDRLEIAAYNVGPLLAALAVGDAVRWRGAYRTAMRERMDQAVVEERLRIARDVHDSIAHAITAINVQAGAAAHLMDRQPEAARAALLEIRRVSGAAVSDLRGTLGQLREGESASLRPAPTISSLDDLVDRVRAAGVEVTLTMHGATDRIAASVDTAAHRIVQEALTNVLRHSGATTARVAVSVTGTDVVLDVSDDGRGSTVPGSTDGAGFGLRGMRERALSVGGSLEAAAGAEGGWRVHAVLPLVAS
jgi:signal transduction histidine kinase